MKIASRLLMRVILTQPSELSDNSVLLLVLVNTDSWRTNFLLSNQTMLLLLCDVACGKCDVHDKQAKTLI